MPHLANASEKYKLHRQRLAEAEAALRDQREHVAALRRQLPRDTVVEDLLFEEVRNDALVPVKLSELFTDPGKPLVLMHFMFGKAQRDPCPMCTMWADGYAGVIEHLSERVNFAVLVADEAQRFDTFAASRSWTGLRLVSAAQTALKRDLGFENDAGEQMPGVSLFERGDDGTLTHFYSICAFGRAGPRMMDLLSPVWNFFDLTPDGRGEFIPSLDY